MARPPQHRLSLAVIAVLLCVGSSGARAQTAQSKAEWPAAIQAYAERRYEEAIARLGPLASSGLPQAQHLLGRMHELGQGTPTNPARALSWYRRAARSDLPAAHTSLAWAALRGVGREVDLAAAHDAFERGGLLGDPEAQLQLARLHDDGLGTRQDSGIAYAWALLAEERGVAGAHAFQQALRRRLSPQEIQSGRVRSAELRRLIAKTRIRLSPMPVRRFPTTQPVAPLPTS